MAGSLFALFDDIAILARAAAATIDDVTVAAAKAASKSAAVLVDDAALTPQYVTDVKPSRELPIIWRIAKGSLVNKAFVIIGIMLLSFTIPWIFPWALIIGGSYLVFEGAEKIVHVLQKNKHEKTPDEVLERKPKDENSIIRSAVTTDLVLSMEVMLIAMSSIDVTTWYTQLLTLIVVGVLMTVMVYGAVAILVRMDDTGLWIARRGVKFDKDWIISSGLSIVRAMPFVFTLLTIVGTAAMLWVGGHLLIVNIAEVGFPAFYELMHGVTMNVTNSFASWSIDTGLSTIFGFIAGVLLVVLWTGAKAVGNLMRGKEDKTVEELTE